MILFWVVHTNTPTVEHLLQQMQAQRILDKMLIKTEEPHNNGPH